MISVGAIDQNKAGAMVKHMAQGTRSISMPEHLAHPVDNGDGSESQSMNERRKGWMNSTTSSNTRSISAKGLIAA